jgi:hypothetical protein
MRISVVTPTIRPEGLVPVRDSLLKQTLTDFEWLTEIGLGKHDLNAAFNRMLRRAEGELIVFVEDWLRFEPDGLQKFWNAYQEDPYTFFTAPVEKTLNWQTTEGDWRSHPASQMNWQSWEIDWGAAPLECLKKIGGFDEAMDGHWAGDNVSVALRANMAQYKFKLLRENKAIALDHNKLTKHPFNDTFNPAFMNERYDAIRQGEIINYL